MTKLIWMPGHYWTKGNKMQMNCTMHFTFNAKEINVDQMWKIFIQKLLSSYIEQFYHCINLVQSM